ncbi:MAG: hypothetical protein JO138_18695 [Acidobacteriaceae bacterium]|nr:hypothetical protein [Acidobacteriaceae bacterium]
MNRRGFLHLLGGAGSAATLAPGAPQAAIPEHNWEKYDFGAGPPVSDRLYKARSHNTPLMPWFPAAM